MIRYSVCLDTILHSNRSASLSPTLVDYLNILKQSKLLICALLIDNLESPRSSELVVYMYIFVRLLSLLSVRKLDLLMGFGSVQLKHVRKKVNVFAPNAPNGVCPTWINYDSNIRNPSKRFHL